LAIGNSSSYPNIYDAKCIEIVRALRLGDIVKCSSLKQIRLVASCFKKHRSHRIGEAAEIIKEGFWTNPYKKVEVKLI
jgi:hypothetical protein